MNWHEILINNGALPVYEEDSFEFKELSGINLSGECTDATGDCSTIRNKFETFFIREKGGHSHTTHVHINAKGSRTFFKSQ